jgi:hypothetical protein
MTYSDVLALAQGMELPHVRVMLIRRGAEHWHISWGNGLTRTAVMVPVDGSTAETVRAAIEAAQ